MCVLMILHVVRADDVNWQGVSHESEGKPLGESQIADIILFI
jgi:hypothetical protein